MEIASVSYKNIIKGSNILKPNYHLNYGKKRVYRALKNQKSFKTLGELTEQVYTGGIFKRIFIENEKFGLPYISGQHMMNSNPLESAKIISKKYTPRQEDMTLKCGQILVSCAGTVGNVRLIGNDLDGVIGSQDIIRIIADETKMASGYLYAYLSTPTAYNYIQSFIYGSVVPRIEPSTLASIPIPILDIEKIFKIDTLIKEATKLRENSISSLNEVHDIFNQTFSKLEDQKTIGLYKSISISNNFHKRLDSSYYLNNEPYETEFCKSKYDSISLGELVKKRMFNANRGKRNYVKTGGIQFLSTSNISEKNPLLIDKYLSLKTDGLETLMVRKNWILISSSGQDILGSCFMVDGTYENTAVNQHSVRVIIDEQKISPFYIFGFLSNPKIKKYLRAGIYGSAVLTINEDFLKNIKIPQISNSETVKKIIELTKNHINDKELACFKEKQAIDIIEKEIESWQK